MYINGVGSLIVSFSKDPTKGDVMFSSDRQDPEIHTAKLGTRINVETSLNMYKILTTIIKTKLVENLKQSDSYNYTVVHIWECSDVCSIIVR